MKVCHVLCPDKKQMLAHVSMSRNAVADGVCEMATGLRTQLSGRSRDFAADSLAVGEKDIFENVRPSVADMKLPWDQLVGLPTDGAPEMCGEKSGLVGRMRVKTQEENCAAESTACHCIIHQETLCGKVLKMEHVKNTGTQSVNLIRAKGLNQRQFQSFLRQID